MEVNSIIRHTQDLNGQLTVIPLRHVLVAGDNIGDRIEVTVLRGGEPVDLSSVGVTGYFIRPDQATVTVTGSVSGNKVNVDLSEACYIVAGQFRLVVKVVMGNVRHAVFACTGTIERSSTSTLVDTGHVIPDIDELLAMIAQIEGAINTAKTTASAASSAADDANTAKDKADKAATAANNAAAAAALWGSVTATVIILDADQPPLVTIGDTSSGKSMVFRIPRGLTGLTPKLTIGKITTGASGSQATATITGTAEAPVLNLTIPRGDVGSIENLTVCGVAPDGSGNIRLTPALLGAVNKAGDTMTGNLTVSRGTSAAKVTVVNDRGQVELMVDTNKGLYDRTKGDWMVYSNANGDVTLKGNANTATKLATPRKISGVAFDGSRDITLTAADVGAVWEAGDTFKIGVSATLNGMITSGSQNLHLLLSVGSAINASAVSVTDLTGTLRGVAGYLDSDSSTRNLLDAPFTCSADIVDAHAGLVRLIITKSTAFGNVTNNTPVSLLAFSLSLKFS